MIIHNNGVKIDATREHNRIYYKILEQSQDATDRIQSVSDISDPDSGIKVRSNRFPSFNEKERRFYFRGFETKKNDKSVEAVFKTAVEAENALNGLKRIVDFLTPENFPINKQTHGKVTPGGTSHCRFHFINRGMAKILCLTGHNHYPIECIKWKKSSPVSTKNPNYNLHIKQFVNTLNNSINNDECSIWAINKIKELFQKSFRDGPSALVACWRVITGFRECDVKIPYELSTSHKGGTLFVRNAFITKEMAIDLELPYYDLYNIKAIWSASEPISTGNVHYDEHIGQVVDVLNKSISVKDYSEDIVNHHRVGTKSAKLVTKLVRESFIEAHNKGFNYLCAMWSIVTGLRGPDFTD